MNSMGYPKRKLHAPKKNEIQTMKPVEWYMISAWIRFLVYVSLFDSILFLQSCSFLLLVMMCWELLMWHTVKKSWDKKESGQNTHFLLKAPFVQGSLLEFLPLGYFNNFLAVRSHLLLLCIVTPFFSSSPGPALVSFQVTSVIRLYISHTETLPLFPKLQVVFLCPTASIQLDLTMPSRQLLMWGAKLKKVGASILTATQITAPLRPSLWVKLLDTCFSRLPCLWQYHEGNVLIIMQPVRTQEACRGQVSFLR